MNKKELITAASQIAGVSQKDTQAVTDALFAVITNTLRKGEKVSLSGFGSFEAKDRRARKGRNIHTGEVIDIPAAKIPGFTPGENLKKAVKEGL